MISSIQTLASFGLKGHFTLYSKVFSYSGPFGSVQGHTLPIEPAMRHFTERTNSSSTERSSDMNTMLSLSSLPRKAPQDVQRRCLLHVQLKVVKAC